MPSIQPKQSASSRASRPVDRGLARALLPEADQQLRRALVIGLQPAAEIGRGGEEGGLGAHSAGGERRLRRLALPRQRGAPAAAPQPHDDAGHREDRRDDAAEEDERLPDRAHAGAVVEAAHQPGVGLGPRRPRRRDRAGGVVDRDLGRAAVAREGDLPVRATGRSARSIAVGGPVASGRRGGKRRRRRSSPSARAAGRARRGRGRAPPPLGCAASNAPNTPGKEIQAPVKLSIASGSSTQKPARWWMLALVEFCRFQRKPRRTLPVIGHHSQMPVRQEQNMKTPTQPTIVRPQPGTVEAAVEAVDEAHQAGVGRRPVEHPAAAPDRARHWSRERAPLARAAPP